MKTVTQSKWWRFFVEASERSRLSEGDESAIIDKMFEICEEPVVYPYMLSTKLFYNAEGEIIDSRNVQAETVSEIHLIKATLSKCKEWCRKNKISENMVYEFINDRTNMCMAERGMLYRPLFLFSKNFNDFSTSITEDDMMKKNVIRAFYPDVYDLLLQSLKDDFID